MVVFNVSICDAMRISCWSVSASQTLNVCCPNPCSRVPLLIDLCQFDNDQVGLLNKGALAKGLITHRVASRSVKSSDIYVWIRAEYWNWSGPYPSIIYIITGYRFFWYIPGNRLWGKLFLRSKNIQIQKTFKKHNSILCFCPY